MCRSRPAISAVFARRWRAGNDPLLLAVWPGPVAWLGVATFEELTRVFMLNRVDRLASTTRALARYARIRCSVRAYPYLPRPCQCDRRCSARISVRLVLQAVRTRLANDNRPRSI